MPEMPEAWQHAVNHWLDVVLAFSGLSLVLGYGVLVLALPLLLLPTAFPELSRPRDGLWSLVLAVLAPLLLLNRLPVFSSAGFGELIATVLMGRLAAEVGQGRWEALTPDQRSALRHLPRWRRAGSDLVTAVAQAATATWSATVQVAKTAWSATVQTATATWRAVLRQKGPVQEQRQPGQAARKPVRKQWIRPDPSDGVQVDQDGETSPGMPDTATEEVEASSGPAIGSVPDAESAQLGAGGDGDPVDVPGAAAVPVDVAPEAPEVVEDHAQTPEVQPPEPVVPPSEEVMVAADEAEQEGETSPGMPDTATEEVEASSGPAIGSVPDAESAQPGAGGDGDPVDVPDVPGAAAVPVDVAPEAPEVVEDHAQTPEVQPPEPVVPPSEEVMVAADEAEQEGETSPGMPDTATEEVEASSGPAIGSVPDAESAQPGAGGDGDPVDVPDVPGAAAVPVDVAPEAPEVVEDHADAEPPEVQPPEPVVPPSEEVMVAADEAEQEGEDVSGTDSAQPAEDDSAKPAQEEEDVVARSFDDVDKKLGGSG